MRDLIQTADQLHRELWTSWASCLRSYSALHGLTSVHHAVVEVGADEILLRVDARWLRFTADHMQDSEGKELSFALNEDGTVQVGGENSAMDLAAEEFARTLLHPA